MRLMAVLVPVLVSLPAARAFAQHEHHQQEQPQPQVEPPPQPKTTLPAEPALPMSPDSSAGLAVRETRRLVSGTAWQPSGTPHAGVSVRAGSWTLMGHALLFGGYDWQGSDRGDHAPVGMGWFMGMAERRLDAGVFMARVMLSPELVTMRDGGYPLLFQTGETWQGQPLHDRQHPHDLLMEAAVMHTQALTPGLALQAYAALAGEPALGPPGFPHRQSAMADPLAVLGHHWQDSTHISFGVFTAGLVTRHAKIEASWFNGHEPDEDRYDVDLHAPNAFAARLSASPSDALVLQMSYGQLPSQQRGHGAHGPQGRTHRMTASASHHRPFGHAGSWATTFVYGTNAAGQPATSAVLLESTLDLDGANVVFGRLEFVQKTGEDLLLPVAEHERRFGIGALALGYLRNFGPFASLVPGVGVRGAVHLAPPGLEQYYGTRLPVGGMIYLRLGIAPRAPAASHDQHH